jgi:hypothetical protein
MSNLKNEKEEMQVRQQIFHTFMEVVDAHPKYNVSQHLSAILRRKAGPEFCLWSNKDLLQRIEQHKQELDGEEIINETED